MRRVLLYALSIGILATLACGGPQPTAAHAQAEAAQKDQADKKAKDGEAKADAKDQAKQGNAKAKQQPRRSRVPKYLARPNGQVQATPHSILTEQEMFVPEAAKRNAVQQPQPRREAESQPVPDRNQPNPPFWSPRQQGLSSAATFRLESMGNHVQLSPAMRLHMSRSSRAQPTIRIPSKSITPGQGAGNYYPGVSRAPNQKPFANLERPASGLETYWPLLLEGRQDPNTGLIIWTLP